jgi:RHS repeat-associated protein
LGINYQLGNALLGNLTYSYDLAGNRTTAGGSYAQTSLPSPLASASYNADNQLIQFGSSNLTCDANGNLTSDGTHTYTWDARNHLVSISGAVSASFQYDAFGRWVSKTVGPATTSYLYDGLNPVQELSGGSPTANLLTGLGTDEYFQRTDASGPANFLTDALGSTIALTGPSGNTLAQYKYDPYGNATMTGSSSNPYQYTGRENDGTGLYYYRARYYDPARGTFISEDPIGFRGGANLYRYAANSPATLTDPLGLSPVGQCLKACLKIYYGLTRDAGIILGITAPLIPKAFSPPGATAGTSVASLVLRKVLPCKIPGGIWAPTFENLSSRTAVLGGALARWLPVAGIALTAIDVYEIQDCTRQCERDNWFPPCNTCSK